MDELLIHQFSTNSRLRQKQEIELQFTFHKGLIGGITDAVGLTDYAGAEKQQAAAIEATKAGTDASVQMSRENIAFQKEQMEFQKEQYNDWKAAYGDITENMGHYYNTLSGTKYATKELTAEATEYKRATKEMTQQLAQRGISSSGVEAAAITAMASQSAATRANVRASADDKAMAQKAGFLGLGLGQGTQMLGVQAQQASTVGQGYNTMASNQLQGAISQGSIGSAYAQQNLSGSYNMTGGLISGASKIGAAMI